MGPWGMQNIKESSYLAQIEMQIPKIFIVTYVMDFFKVFYISKVLDLFRSL